MASLALALSRRGLLREADVQGDLTGAVVQSMAGWLESQWGGMRWFEFRAHLLNSVMDAVTNDTEELIESWGNERVQAIFWDSCGVDPYGNHVGLGLVPAGRMDVLVGEGVERLEAACKGLGFAVLSEIENACIPYDLFGPSWLEYAAESAWWCGMPSEVAMAEECGEPLSDYEGVKRDDLEAQMPIRRLREAGKLTTKRLMELMQSKDQDVTRAVSLLIQLRRLHKVKPTFAMEVLTAEVDWYDSISPTVLVGWNDMKMVEQAGDDWSNELLNGGAELREWTAVMGIPLNSPQALREMEMRWKLPLKKLRLADALLSEIGKEA